jgi:predicted nucleic acid-binding protein
MDTLTLVLVVVVVAVLLIGLAVLAGRGRQRRSEHLQERFGDEYERTVEREGDQRAAEEELARRERRRRKFDIRPLDPEARDRYAEAWRETQVQFVDDPSGATRNADLLVAAVMRDRGYPLDEFEKRSADISVDFPEVVEDYRIAHDISVANDEDRASTEDLRRALIYYRRLFERMLADPQPEDAERR